jgi:hypothetical protein
VAEHESDIIDHLDEETDAIQDVAVETQDFENSAPDAMTDGDINADGEDSELL